MPAPLKVFIGYDHRQPVAYSVCSQSILSHASKPVSITPLVLSTLPITRQGLTPFTFSRFLVPYLCDYEGWALFLDVDTLVLGDIAEVFSHADDSYTVMVSKNEQRFEWASVMLFNCAKCRDLTPAYVETINGLHTMQWLPESQVGELPPEWNHLVGYDALRPDAQLVHFTQGIPAFPETKDSEYAHEWQAMAKLAAFSMPWQTLMGQSVHTADGKKPKLESHADKPGNAGATPVAA